MSSQLPYWHAVELTAGSRPMLREKEIDVLVEDGIGLYQGKAKINNRQDGRCYLTSQRIIYIDNQDPKQYSVSIELDDVSSIDYTSRFLKSSPKIIIFFKKNTLNSDKSTIKKDINWICPICSFPNLVEEDINYNNYEVLPVCETCGVISSKELIEETIIHFKKSSVDNKLEDQKNLEQIPCNICTFLNHPSLRNCEICGSSLPINEKNLKILQKEEIFDDRIKIEISSNDDLTSDNLYIKISFHNNNKGDRIFFNKLNEVIENFKWEQVIKTGNVNKSAKFKNNDKVKNDREKSLSFGIHSITQKNELINEKNEEIINSSLDNLDELLNRADEISQLINSFKPLKDTTIFSVEENNNSLNNSIIDLNLKNDDSKKLFIQEISRKISEFLINGNILNEQGGMITLLDLYALFNRGRIGENLISPRDLYESCLEFKNLKLPLILKKINSILIISSTSTTSNSNSKDLNNIILEIKNFIVENGDVDLNNYKFSNVLKISEFFNWNLNITEEFLKIGIELGEFVIDKQIFGKHYYLNLFNSSNESVDFNKIIEEKKLIENVDDDYSTSLINE